MKRLHIATITETAFEDAKSRAAAVVQGIVAHGGEVIKVTTTKIVDAYEIRIDFVEGED